MVSLFKLSGALFGLLPIGFLLFGLITNRTHEMIPFIIAGASINILFSFVLFHFFKIPVLREWKEGNAFAFKKINSIVVALTLTVTYIAGIGIVFIFARLFKKKFFHKDVHTSTWVVKSGENSNFTEG